MNRHAHIDALIDDESLSNTLKGLVNIASPTGEEAPLAAHIANQLAGYGLEAQTQYINATQANAFGQINSAGSNNLLLYAPMDTVTSNSETEDIPWAGPIMQDYLRASAYEKEGHIFGLGAHNPKGHAACILEAARILKSMDILLPGSVYFGFGAGGMPTHGRKGFARNTGHGSGCLKLLETLPDMDAAIIAKSGTSVTWEEVGFCWFEVTVEGKHNYVGARHLMPYDNAIANASRLILKLENWFEDYSERHASAFCRPQGTVSFIESGWKRMPAFTPAAARFLVDLRFAPDQSPDDVEAEFARTVERFSKDLDLQTSINRIQTIPASRTSRAAPIIHSTIKVWEELQGRAHDDFMIMSGSTDANMLRNAGIPTARIGLAKAQLPDLDFALGMNCVAISDLRHLTKFLVLSVIEYFERVA